MSVRIRTAQGPTKGDERRTALLGALDGLLREVDSVESINVADLSRRAGVARSAFYFYFQNKAEAVGALMEVVYDEAAAAGALLVDTSLDPTERIPRVIGEIFDVTERHGHLYRAVLEARATNPSVREVQPRDVSLDGDLLREAGIWWAGDRDPADPLISPIYGDLSDLPAMTVVQGGRDVLAPDVIKMVGLVGDAGGHVRMVEEPEGFHVYVAGWWTPEADTALEAAAQGIRGARGENHGSNS